MVKLEAVLLSLIYIYIYKHEGYTDQEGSLTEEDCSTWAIFGGNNLKQAKHKSS